MDKAALRTVLNKAAAFFMVFLVYALMEGLGITCPILFLTGISCAGCGMSRAWLSLLCGDLHAALSYHPLFFLPPLVLAGWLMRKVLPRRLLAAGLWAVIILFLAVYAMRMADPQDMIVVFAPENGLIAQTVRMAASFLSG